MHAIIFSFFGKREKEIWLEKLSDACHRISFWRERFGRWSYGDACHHISNFMRENIESKLIRCDKLHLGLCKEVYECVRCKLEITSSTRIQERQDEALVRGQAWDFSYRGGYLILQFKFPIDCSNVPKSGPQIIASQLFTMESWEPDFMLGRRPIQKTQVWLKLPGLPMELWSSSIILAITTEVGKSLAIDDFTDMLRKTMYALIKVEIDVGQPFKSGVLIRGRRHDFW